MKLMFRCLQTPSQCHIHVHKKLSGGAMCLLVLIRDLIYHPTKSLMQTQEERTRMWYWGNIPKPIHATTSTCVFKLHSKFILGENVKFDYGWVQMVWKNIGCLLANIYVISSFISRLLFEVHMTSFVDNFITRIERIEVVHI